MSLGLLGSASTLGIGLAVTLDDQFSQASTRVSNTLRLMGKDLDDFSQGMQTLSSIGDTLSRFGDRVYQFGSSAAKEFTTFEHSINATRVIAGIDKTNSGYKELGDTAQRLSGIYAQLPDKIGDAELELAKGGKSVPEINKMTEAVVALGAATQTPVEGGNGTATVLLNIMQAYNASSSEAVHYADIITSAANQSTIDVRDLFESLRYSADVSSTLNIPFEETAASIATLGNASLKGSMAGTAYANMLRYLESGIGIFATKRQKAALGLLGLSKKDMVDEQGHLISMGKLLNMVRDRTKTFDDTDKLGVLSGIFGVRGNRAMLNLLKGKDKDSHGTTMSAFDAMSDKIHQDTLHDITRKTATQMLDDTEGLWRKITVAWSNFKIAIGGSLVSALAPLGQILIHVLTGLTNFFNGTFGHWITRFIFGSGLFLSVIGRMIATGARFMGYIVGSAGRLTNAFEMATVASNSIRAQLTAAAAAIERSALLARGITGFNNSAGTAMLVARGAGGRFAGAAVERSLLSSGLGMIFGKMGLRWAVTIERFLGPLIGAGTWLAKTGIALKVFGGFLGKALGWLFGWEGMLVDLGLTMLTGKGIFEWLWTGFRSLFGWLFGMTDDAKKSTSKGIYHVDANKSERVTYDTSDHRTQKMKDWQDSQTKTISAGPKAPMLINLIVHAPAVGKYNKQLEVQHERELQSHSIIQ